MGGAAPSSFHLPTPESLPAQLDLPTFQELSRGQFSRQLFDDLVDTETGTVSGEDLRELLTVKKDCFMSYDWGPDGEGHDNRARVFRVNDWLKSNGIVTWYHTGVNRDHHTRHVTEEGISNSAMTIVFLTKGYIERVNTHDSVHDTCRLEFMYSNLHKTPERMLPVVMDAYSSDDTRWLGPLTVLAGRPYVDLSNPYDEQHFDDSMIRLLREILAITTPLMTKYLRKPIESTLYIPHLAFKVKNDEEMAEVRSRGARKASTPQISIVAMKTSGEVFDERIEHSILAAVDKEDRSFDVMYKWLLDFTPQVALLSEHEALQRLDVITALCAGDCRKRKKLGPRAAQVCAEALGGFPQSAVVAERGCKALKALAFATVSRRAQIAAIGGPAVVAAVRTFTGLLPVVEHGLNALHQFAMAPGSSKTVLARVGALDVVAEATATHLQHVRVAEYGCGAIWHLCDGNAQNKAELAGRLGACALVLEALRTHLRASYQLTQNALGAVAYLAEEYGANKVMLGSLGACEIIVEAIEEHPDNVKVAQMACTAVSALTKGNALNKTTLGTNGGAEALIATLRRHADITAVMEVCCVGVHNLASSDPVAASMGGKGVTAALMGVLQANRAAGHVVVEALKAAMRLAAGAVGNATSLREEGFLRYCEEYVDDPNMPPPAKEWAKKALTLVSRAVSINHLST